MKSIAIYSRVSSAAQDCASQQPDLEAWAAAQNQPIKWFTDKASGKSMDRPGWTSLEAAIRKGQISAVVCWRIDRLGRTARGLTALFDDLQQRKVNLISLRDGLDLSTAAGRLMANVLASVAQFETEVRGERVRAGQVAARKRGVKWGGSKKGVRKRLTPQQVAAIGQLRAGGMGITAIAAAVGVGRPTVYSVLRASAAAVPPSAK